MLKAQTDTEEEITAINYAAPYLASIGDPEYLSRPQATIVRDMCLNDFKKSQVQKATKLQLRIEECKKALKAFQTRLTMV